ncbi:MAG TPA: hypothetical protein VK783_01390 [Bacteroidia bacterium]|nr:hypothetical protein [Bacteroidia bacterium]
MGDIVFCSFYILLFSFIILKTSLFKLPGLNNWYSLGAFYLKLLFGVALWYLYAYHYKNRYSSDIFKYFDDGKIIYKTFHTNFSDFVKMFTGIGDSDEHIQKYYHSMVSWINEHGSTFYNNSHLLIRLNTFFMFFSFGHYGVHVIFMCFISLTGLTFLYKSFWHYVTDMPKSLFIAIFLFPSVLLWGSGILKEGLVLFALGLCIYYSTRIKNKEGNLLFSALTLALGMLLLFEVKAYVLLCILPGFIAEYLIARTKFARNKPWLTYAIVILTYMAIGFNLNLVSPKLNPLEMLADKQVDFLRTAKGGIYLTPLNDPSRAALIQVDDSVFIIPANAKADSLLKTTGVQYLTSSSFCYQEEQTGKIIPFKLKQGLPFDLIHTAVYDTVHQIGNDSTLYRLDRYIEPAKSRISATPFQPDLKGLLSYIPTALIISMLRPYPHEIHSAAVLIYFFENVLMILLIAFAFAFRKRKNPNNHIVAFCISYCIFMLVLIGITTPLYGGIERYKSVVIPFMLILLLLIYDKEKFKRTLKG